ncbi:class E sortase [Streptomyces marincola]|uniref:Class E sortase n=1 Tax=Streptomyces marincola TaxID=2878388 RepID=A0A1W7CZJ4_9ACTN|nr:class E sortase [Streptomyces marincola]
MPSSTERSAPATPRDEENAPDAAPDEHAREGTAAGETPEKAAAEEKAPGEPEKAAPRPKAPAGRRRLAMAVSVFGELLITAGVVLGLFVAYSLWWTNVVANQEAARDGDAVREHWAAGADGDDGDDRTAPATYDPEDGIGFLHVPTMSDDDILVKEGIDLDTLNGGVAGYYDEPVESAMPWDDEGNFSLAAHRDGHGAKFHDIQRIEEGDPIVFETANTWYIYRAYAILPETSKYNIEVLDPVPAESGATEAGRYITLTTCTPLYTSRHRYIVWGELERTERIDEDRTPPRELLDADNG